MKGISIYSCALLTAVLFLVGPSASRGDVLETTPAACVAMEDAGEVTKVAVIFDLASIRKGSGFEINEAFVEFTIDALPSEGARLQLKEILNPWTFSAKSLLSTAINMGDSKSEWELATLDLERIGGLVRLDAAPLVRKWIQDPTKNFGMIIETADCSRDRLQKSVLEGRLIVRYGFSGPVEATTSSVD